MPRPSTLRKRGTAKAKVEEPGPSKVARKAEPSPTKEVKKEEIKGEEEEDVKDLPPVLVPEEAVGSANIHVKGIITPEQLAHRIIRQCDYCDFTAVTEDRLIAHRETKHKVFFCRFCQTVYPNKFEQSRHLNVCDKLLAMRAKVKAQVDEIQDRNSKHIAIQCMLQKIKCPICKGTFNSMFEMGDHRRHPCKSYAVRLFMCNGCKIQFSTSNGLKSHLISRYNEKDYKCFDAGVLSFESLKIPKFTRSACHIYYKPNMPNQPSPVTLSLVPIKAEPTDKDEIHDRKTQLALVAAHLLSDHDGARNTEYYFAMRRMFYKVNCPYCGIQCRTHAALHSHGLIHHPPHDRCLYQCGGCQVTYQTPTGLGQHLKREFDNSNSVCYNTINLVKKEDYLGPVTGWNKRIKPKEKNGFVPRAGEEMFPNTTDVKPDPDFAYEEVVKKEEPDSDDYPSSSIPSTSTGRLPLPSSSSSIVTLATIFDAEREVKEEPLDY